MLDKADNISIKDHGDPFRKKIIITLILSFFIPVIIMGLAFAKVRISPDGTFTVFLYDLQVQFMPVFASLRYLGRGDNSVLFSLFGALGNNALLNYKSYLANPAFRISSLFPLKDLPDILYYSTLFYIGICGVSFCVFLFWGKKETRIKRYPLMALVLSCCYSLISYNVAYSLCINWILEVALLPMILLGVERLIEGKKGLIYVLALTYALYNSDQLPYISGVFATLYLGYRLCETKNNRIKIIIRYIVCSLLSLGLAMPIFFPMMLNILEGRMKIYNPTTSGLFYYMPWEVFKQFLSCQYTDIRYAGLPYIFCGTFVPLLAILGLFSSNTSKKSRIVAVIMIIFIIVSFSFVPFNKFWHGFTEPNGFPARYSYTLSAFLLILAYDSSKTLYEKFAAPGIMGKLVGMVILLITVTELYLNSGYILSSNNLTLKYKNKYEYQVYVDQMEDALNHISDDGLYRIGRDITYTYNDGMLFGYNGIGYFSSMYEPETMNFIGRLGYSQNVHLLKDSGGTPLSESLLGVRYKVMNHPDVFWKYDEIYRNSSFGVELNEHALPFGYAIEYQGLAEMPFELVTTSNSLYYQETILDVLCGYKTDIYEPIDFSLEKEKPDDQDEIITISFKAKNDKPVWIYADETSIEGEKSVESAGNSHMEMTVNGESLFPFADGFSTMCTYLGSFDPGEDVTVSFRTNMQFDDYWIAYFDEDACYEALDKLAGHGLNVKSHSDGKIEGAISVPWNDSILLLTIPYMKGYTIKVDGQKSGYGSFSDVFVILPLNKGEHTIEISYCPPGLIPGLIICGVSLIIILIMLLWPFRSTTLPEDSVTSDADELNIA